MPNSSSQFTIYGNVDDVSLLPDAYKIKITSIRDMVKVVASIQDDIQLKVASQWQSVVPQGALSLGNIIAQFVTEGKKSLITKWGSRRIWSGSTPIIIGLNLRFEAVENAFKEVLEPCRVLQGLALGSETSGVGENGESELFLSPPGPSPFMGIKALEKYRRSNSTLNDLIGAFNDPQKGNFILIELGDFVTFWNVIISEVTVSYSPKFQKDGNPVSANVNIVFETYEMPTVEGLKEAYSRSDVSEVDDG